MRLHASVTAVLAAFFLAVLGPTVAWGCAGDCDGDCQVTVDEVLTLVNDALAPPPGGPNCGAGDANTDGPENPLVHWSRIGILAGAPSDPALATRTPRSSSSAWSRPRLRS